ncbi:MAG: hypothetical protein AAGI07_09565 [Bacteroidota bacterium]
MKIVTTTNTWSIESGDDEYYFKDREYKLRLLFEASTLKLINNPNDSYSITHLSNTENQISGKVIFKDEYLLIIENKIRFGIVLNNQFRFGNSNSIGNKDIDHSMIQVGAFIEATGFFRFQRIFFCIFTFLPDELSIPNIDYKWKVSNIYRITEDYWDSCSLSELEKVDKIDTSSQDFEDMYAIEFKLQDETPYHLMI